MKMPKLKFPAAMAKEKIFPGHKKKAKCPVCGKGTIFHSLPHAAISGGGLLLGPREKSGIRKVKRSSSLKAYLWFDWYIGATRAAASNDPLDPWISLPLVVDVDGGQFELRFCSVNCMRKYLNAGLDELEKKVSRKRKRRP